MNITEDVDQSEDTIYTSLDDYHESLSPDSKHHSQTEIITKSDEAVRRNSGVINTDNEGKFLCDICKQTYSNKSNLTAHRKKHDGVIFPCKQCEYQAVQLSGLINHVKSKHDGVRFPCQQCDYKATRSGHLTRHVKSKHSTQNK